MPRNSETRSDPLKPGLFRPKQIERIRHVPASAEPSVLPASIDPHRWERAETSGDSPTQIWMSAEPRAERSTLTQATWNILVVTGDPSANGNRFDREIAHMRASGIPIMERSSISALQLATYLRDSRPVVLHVSAHASEEDLALHTDGRINWAPFPAVAKMLLSLPAPRLLVLYICSCRVLAGLLGTWATTTVFWADTIDDDIARAFSSPFYLAMLNGESVKDAITIARADTPELLGPGPDVRGYADLVLTPRAHAEWRRP